MIGKLPEGVNWGQNTMTQKINEIIDKVNWLCGLPKPTGGAGAVVNRDNVLAMVDVTRTYLDEIEKEIRKGSI